MNPKRLPPLNNQPEPSKTPKPYGGSLVHVPDSVSWSALQSLGTEPEHFDRDAGPKAVAAGKRQRAAFKAKMERN